MKLTFYHIFTSFPNFFSISHTHGNLQKLKSFIWTCSFAFFMSPEGACGFCFVFFFYCCSLFFLSPFLLLLFYSCLMQNKNLIVLHDVVFNACNTCDNKVWNLNFFNNCSSFCVILKTFDFFFSLKVWIIRHLNENVIKYKLTLKESISLHQNPSYRLSTGFSLKPVACKKKKERERRKKRGQTDGAQAAQWWD